MEIPNVFVPFLIGFGRVATFVGKKSPSENIQTKIKIDSDVKITMERLADEVEVIEAGE